VELLVRRGESEYWTDHLHTPADFRGPFGGAPYVCLVWATRPATLDERAALARALVTSNCGYAVCAGMESEAWHDMVDETREEADRFLMTTWHDNEPLEDVVNFFVWNTDYEENVFTRFLIVVVGPDDGIGGQLTDVVRGLAPDTRRVAP